MDNIPFAYFEMDFDSEEKARLWIIRNQLSRRNLPDFVKCELVLPFEAELKAEAKKRQGQRNDLLNIPQNSAECLKNRETREELAALAGVSRDSISKTKQILAEADEETKEKLRKGEMSINRAYTSLKEKADTAPKRPDLLPYYSLVKDMPPMKEGAYVRPPDSVYDIPPIVVYGNMPADDMERRGIAEIAHVKSDMNECMSYCVRKVSDIMRDIRLFRFPPLNLNYSSQCVCQVKSAVKGPRKVQR